MQPRVAIAVADSVAVAIGPAPATSPVAVRDASVAVLETVRSGLPTKWRPPSRVIEVGATANVADAVRARTAMTVANTVISLRIPVPFQLELCVRPSDAWRCGLVCCLRRRRDGLRSRSPPLGRAQLHEGKGAVSAGAGPSIVLAPAAMRGRGDEVGTRAAGRILLTCARVSRSARTRRIRRTTRSAAR